MRPTMVSGSGSGTAMETYRHTGALSGVTGWYSALHACRTANNQNHPAGTLLAVPFSADRNGTIDLIAVRVTTIAGGGNKLGRLGIYRADSFTGSLYPTALIAEGVGTFSTAATGWQQLAIAATVTTKYPYYLALILDHTGADPLFWGFAVGDTAAAMGNRTTASAVYYLGWEVALAFPAAMPTTFTAGAARKVDGGPLVFVHYAS